jgi:hypothetical protein
MYTFRNGFSLWILFFCAFPLAVVMTAYGQVECSPAKTNHSCTLTIDRNNPLAPPQIQMYPNQELTVLVKNPHYFERYFLDYSTGQTVLAPDVSSSIVSGMLGPLAKLGEFREAQYQINKNVEIGPEKCSFEDIAAKPHASWDDITNNAPYYKHCFAKFAEEARKVYLQLEPFVAPDSHSHNVPSPPITNAKAKETLDTVEKELDRTDGKVYKLLSSESQLSANIGAIPKPEPPKPSDDSSKMEAYLKQLAALQELNALKDIADAVAKDLFSYGQRIGQLPEVDDGQTSCVNLTQVIAGNENGDKGCILVFAFADPKVANGKMMTRQVTYSLTTLNLVSNSQDAIPDASKKKPLVSITIVFGDTRVEASAGAFFSSLPIRSFSVASIYTNGSLTGKQVSENILRPTVVPFVAANFRISNDLSWTSWRSAIYWTAAVGVNPNTVSADFASGPSISWRGLMFSPLWHLGHDVRLTQGFYVGQDLGTSFSGSLTTQNYWTSSFAIGVSIRTPSLTGR